MDRKLSWFFLTVFVFVLTLSLLSLGGCTNSNSWRPRANVITQDIQISIASAAKSYVFDYF
jgi:hypothetical protein